MIFLDVTGPDGGRTVAFPTAELSIGSGSDCDLQLDAPGVERYHASLIERGGQAILLDAGTSTVAIDGRRVVETAVLVEGCVVTIGPFRLRFREVDLPPDTVQTQTIRQPTAPPIPMSSSDIEIFSRSPSTHEVVSVDLIDDDDDAVDTPHRAPPSSLHASEDPVEIEFLRAIDENDDALAARAVYADWLEERGDKARADYLRTLEKLVAGDFDPITVGNIRSLGPRIANAWRARVLPRATPIERCARASPSEEPCPGTWGALDRLVADDIRRCDVCVYPVQYASDVTSAALRTGPVVIDLAEPRYPGDLARAESRSHAVRGRRTSRVDFSFVAAGACTNVASFYRECARLESLAVTAFAHLYEELTAHEAPLALRQRALDAAHEETQHVRLMEDLAGRTSGWLAGFDAAAPIARRSAFEVARENAVEGCVRETYGALVARHHAAHASAATARAMEKIARDEESHAALSWDVARWIEPRLSPDERRELARVRKAALGELLAEAARPVDPALVAEAGCPDASAAVTFVRRVSQEVDAFDA